MVNRFKTRNLSFFYDYVIEGDIIYFPNANYNAICKGDLTNDQADIIDVFPDVPLSRRSAYIGIYKYKEYLLFFPGNVNDNIIIYNILKHSFSDLPIKKGNTFYSNTIFELEGYIYMVSCITAEVYKVSLQSDSIECIACKEYLSDNAQIYELKRKDDSIFIPLNQRRVMLVFDLIEEKYECYKYPESILFISTITCQDDKLWITGKDRKIYTWDIKKKTICICAELPEDIQPFIEEPVYFGDSFIHENILWLFPVSTDVIVKYNILTGSFEKLAILGEEENKNNHGVEPGRFLVSKFVVIKRHENQVFFMSSKTCLLYQLDLTTDSIQKHGFPLVNSFNGIIYPEPENGVMFEASYVNGLGLLMDNLAESYMKPAMDKELSVGENIYKYINDNLL